MDHMNLQDFIRATLVQITLGVEQAIKETGGQASGVVNPRQPNANISEPTAVEFDVAVTVTEGGEAGGKAKLSVAWLNLGGAVGGSYQNQSISRIRFSVPVSLPSTERSRFKQQRSPQRQAVGAGSVWSD